MIINSHTLVLSSLISTIIGAVLTTSTNDTYVFKSERIASLLTYQRALQVSDPARRRVRIGDTESWGACTVKITHVSQTTSAIPAFEFYPVIMGAADTVMQAMYENTPNPVHWFIEDSYPLKFTFNPDPSAPHPLEWIDVGNLLMALNYLFQKYEIWDVVYEYQDDDKTFAFGMLFRDSAQASISRM